MKKTTSVPVATSSNGIMLGGTAVTAMLRKARQYGGRVVAELNPDGTISVRANVNKVDIAVGIVNEAYRKNYSVRFTTQGNVTFCVVVKAPGGYTLTGTAVCAPGEMFIGNIGRAIAYLRAVGEPIPPELLS